MRTTRPKCCILVLSLTVAASIIVIFGLSIAVGVASNKRSAGSEGMCLTEGCVQLAASVLSRMDTSVDPCVNFYNFSCGKWERNNVVPSGTCDGVCVGGVCGCVRCGSVLYACMCVHCIVCDGDEYEWV